jgi:hypothetical protein
MEITMSSPTGVSHTDMGGEELGSVQISLGIDLGAKGSDFADLLEQESFAFLVTVNSDS